MSLEAGAGVLVSLGSGGGVVEGVSLVGGGNVEPGPASLLPGGTGLGGVVSLEVGPGVLVPLGSGGGVVEGESLVGGGNVEPGSTPLLPGGTGLGGAKSLDVGPGVLGALGCAESLVGVGGLLAPLGSGGDVVDGVSLGGTVEPGSVPLLPGSVLGKVVSLEPGPGVLGSEPLVGGGGVLASLGSGDGVSDVSDCVSLGGIVEPSLLSIGGGLGSPEGPGLVGGSLDVGLGKLGVEPGGWLDVVDGRLLSVGDGSGETTDSSEPADTSDSLGVLGTGESLGGGGPVSELASLVPLGVVAEPGDDGVVEAVGLVDVVEGIEPGEGASVEDATGAEPELG